MTMNRHWGWNKNDDKWKSPPDLVHKLIDIASKGGNFLLNIGPTPEGTFPQPSIERLSGIGDWMEVNAESRYGTSASPYPAPEWGRYTTKGNILYAHIFDWPKEGAITIEDANLDIRTASLLANPREDLKVEKSGSTWKIHLPKSAPDAIATVVAVTFN